MKHKGVILILCAFWILTAPQPSTAQESGALSIISTNPVGEVGNKNSGRPSISSEGRFIAYQSLANNLVAGDTNETGDIFVYDRQTQQTTRVTVSSQGEQANGFSDFPAIAGNGRMVVFRSQAKNLTEIRTENELDIYVYDRLTQEVRFIPQAEWGTIANHWSDAPTISFDGRYIGFSTIADNILYQDQNDNWDIFIHDQVTGHNTLASVASSGEPANGLSYSPVLADSGRDIVFESVAPNILPDENVPSILAIYQRVLGKLTTVPIPVTRVSYLIMGTDLSYNANVLAYALCEIVGGEDQLRVYAHYPQENPGKPIFVQAYPTGVCHEQNISLALSSNGYFLALSFPVEPNWHHLIRIDLKTGAQIKIDEGLLDRKIDISTDGQVITYAKDIEGVTQVFVWDDSEPTTFSHIITGQVTDQTGQPLALVTIETDQGHTTRTDGQGYFWINTITPGPIKATALKEGFKFEPKEISAEVMIDRYDFYFVYAHKESLVEAQKDLGMPYNFDRGSSGPFHGYSAGYCTDLILDAFTWGVDFNIQFALEQDFRSQPWHYYRWRDARDAQDMWRYFSYSGQMQPHTNPYQPGDIVFFDWSQDGEIDHVALVSEVNSAHRPVKMYDATGVINSNPSGLAAELPWESFHEETVRGFVRWAGTYEPPIHQVPQTSILQMALGSPGADLRLMDLDGQVVAKNGAEIPTGRFDDWVWEQSISVTEPEGPHYLVVISTDEDIDTPYMLGIQWVEDGLVAGRVEGQGILNAGETRSLRLRIIQAEANLELIQIPERRVTEKVVR